MKRFLLATACDARHADFALGHWLPSLRANVVLEDIDVVFFDFGLGAQQKQELRDAGVEVVTGTGSGTISSKRHAALAEMLRERPYEQASLVDCGDLIYQRDVSGLFTENVDDFRAVCEDVCCDFLVQMMDGGDFDPAVWRAILRELRDEPMINGSGVLAPRPLWLEFDEAFRKGTLSQDRFGTDQAFVNSYLHEIGFVRLPSTFNFSLKTTREPFEIRDSQFFDEAGELIAVVHNTGGRPASRAIRGFGYGPGTNLGVRRFGRWATRTAYTLRRTVGL